MNSFGHSTGKICLLALVTGLQLFLSSPGECQSLEIKGQRAFTFWEGVDSEIDFFIYNMSHENETKLYVSKGALHHNTNISCKLLLTQTTCSVFTGSCQCSTRPSEGRLEVVFKRKFQAQDAGEWVFEVWDTDIKQTVYISVKAAEVTSNTPLRSHAPTTTPTSSKKKTTKASAGNVKVQTPKRTPTSTTTSTFIPNDYSLSNKSEVVGVAHEPQRTGLAGYIVVIIVLLIVFTGVALTLGFVGWRHPDYIRSLRSYLAERIASISRAMAAALRHTHTCFMWVAGLRNHLTSPFEANTYDRPTNRASEGVRYSALAKFFRRSRPASRGDTYESYICTDDDGYLITSFDGKDKTSSCNEEPPLDDYPRSSNIYEIPSPGGNIKQLH